MIKVVGKAVIELPFIIELDVDDISTNAMSLSQSDKLIKEAIVEKYEQFVDEIHVDFIVKI